MTLAILHQPFFPKLMKSPAKHKNFSEFTTIAQSKKFKFVIERKFSSL